MSDTLFILQATLYALTFAMLGDLAGLWTFL